MTSHLTLGQENESTTTPYLRSRLIPLLLPRHETREYRINAYALMRIPVVADSQGLSDGNRKAPKVSPVPNLIERP